MRWCPLRGWRRERRNDCRFPPPLPGEDANEDDASDEDEDEGDAEQEESEVCECAALVMDMTVAAEAADRLGRGKFLDRSA